MSQMLDSKLEMGNKDQICDDLELNHVLDREVTHLSGGELQRFAIAMSCIQKADVYVQIQSLPFYPHLDIFVPDTCLTKHQVILISNNA